VDGVGGSGDVRRVVVVGQAVKVPAKSFPTASERRSSRFKLPPILREILAGRQQRRSSRLIFRLSSFKLPLRYYGIVVGVT